MQICGVSVMSSSYNINRYLALIIIVLTLFAVTTFAFPSSRVFKSNWASHVLFALNNYGSFTWNGMAMGTHCSRAPKNAAFLNCGCRRY
jgi:hypothetical protein